MSELTEAIGALEDLAEFSNGNAFAFASNLDGEIVEVDSTQAAAILDYIAAQDKRIAELQTMLNEAIYDRNIEAEVAGGHEKTLTEYEHDLIAGIIAPEGDA